MKNGSSIFLLIFASLWGGFLGVVDVVALRGVFKQVRAATFPTTTGQITQSETRRTIGSKGRATYSWTIVYRYTAAGQEWTSNRVSFGTGTFGDGSAQARSVTARYPVGKEVMVHYDPTAPDTSVIEPGLLPDHLVLALFLTPHHTVGIGMLMIALVPLARKWRGLPDEPVLRRIDDLRMAMRMPWLPAWGVGIITLGVSALAAIVLVALTLPLPPPTFAIILVWVILIGVTSYMVRRRRAQFDASLADLTIDASARTATLPLGDGRKERVTLPFADVHGISITVRRFGATSTGLSTSRRNRRNYDLALLGPNSKRFLLVSSGNEEQLQKIADALHDTFGWPLAESAFS